MSENLFSKTIVWQRQIIAIAVPPCADKSAEAQQAESRRARKQTKNRRESLDCRLPQDSLRINKKGIPITLLTTSAGLSRPREAVAIVDCWVWQKMTENLFSKSIIWQRQLFATANNSRKQISLPHRHRLKGEKLANRQKNKRAFPNDLLPRNSLRVSLLTQT